MLLRKQVALFRRTHNSSVIRQNGESKTEVTVKQTTPNFRKTNIWCDLFSCYLRFKIHGDATLLNQIKSHYNN